MSNTLNWNDATVDYGLLEKVNPVFNTAKMLSRIIWSVTS